MPRCRLPSARLSTGPHTFLPFIPRSHSALVSAFVYTTSPLHELHPHIGIQWVFLRQVTMRHRTTDETPISNPVLDLSAEGATQEDSVRFQAIF